MLVVYFLEIYLYFIPRELFEIFWVIVHDILNGAPNNQNLRVPVPKRGNPIVKRSQFVYSLLLYTTTFTQQNEDCDWLILGHVPLFKFKCIPTGIKLRSCCPRAEYNSTWSVHG